MRNYIIVALLCIVGMLSACSVLGGDEEAGIDPLVITTRDNVVEERREEAATFPMDQFPQSVVDALLAELPEGTELVVVPAGDVLDPDAPAAPFNKPPSESTIDILLGTGFNIAKGFIPGLAVWEGVLTLFSRRKQKHYMKAVKQAVPGVGNTTTNWIEAAKSVARAVGGVHSSKDTESLFAEEEVDDQARWERGMDTWEKTQSSLENEAEAELGE